MNAKQPLFPPSSRQVWVCLDEPTLPRTCLGEPLQPKLSSGGPALSSRSGGRALACYGYNEATELFVYWGPNTRLQLVGP